jgi:hypothetical protein
MKYDVSALTVSIKQQQHSIGRFLVRICGIVGGIFATSGTSKGTILAVCTYNTGSIFKACCIVLLAFYLISYSAEKRR